MTRNRINRADKLKNVLWRIREPFTLWAWKYWFEKPKDPTYCSWWIRFWCRYKGHPEGVWWYNPYGEEPNNHCKVCDDEL